MSTELDSHVRLTSNRCPRYWKQPFHFSANGRKTVQQIKELNPRQKKCIIFRGVSMVTRDGSCAARTKDLQAYDAEIDRVIRFCNSQWQYGTEEETRGE